MKSPHLPTVHDIAAAAGVSIATVSQVLNNRGQRFRPETRERVWQAALKAGYRANPAARTLRTGRLNAVGLLIGQPTGSHLPEPLLRGLTDAVERSGGHLVVARVDENEPESLTKLERRLGVDGLLLNVHHNFGQSLLRQRRHTSLPTIWINGGLESDCVGPDDHSAGRCATEHLLAQGHQQVVWLDVLCPTGAAYQAAHHSVREREDGYRAIMQVHGHEPRVLRPATALGPADMNAFTRTFLTKNPQAVFACYSFHSYRALQLAAAALSRPCPATVIISDEDPHTYALAVDYVRLPWEQVGQRSVQLLQQRLHTEQSQPAEVCAPRFCGLSSGI